MNVKRLIVASKNKGKLKEISDILGPLNIEVLSMEEIGYNDDIIEDGDTFEENAYIKSKAIFDKVNEPVFADDSGLEVEYLNGAPGIYSARFAGENATDKERIDKLLEMLKNVPHEKRKAKFVCVISVILNENEKFTVRGECNGYIAEKELGENGFGYDPIFYIEEKNKNIAQLTKEEKNRISHRSIALKNMINKLNSNYKIN